MAVALFLLGTILLLMIVSGIYVFVAACVRKKELPWLVEEEIKKTPYGRFHEGMRAADQWLRDHHAQDVTVMSEDALRLHGLWIPAENPVGTVLLAHGYRSTILLDFSCAFEYYHDMGFHILAPEQRSHGRSEGMFITFGVKECRDMQRWLDFHNRQNPGLPVLLHGLSMGASTVLYLADEKLPDNVKGIVADCGFTSPWEILSCVYRRVTHLPAVLSLWVTELAARALAGFSLKGKDTCKVLKNSRLPVLMIHGTEDGFVPCEMTKQAFSACTGEKKLLLVDGADHGVSFLKDRQSYTNTLTEFIHEHVIKEREK